MSTWEWRDAINLNGGLLPVTPTRPEAKVPPGGLVTRRFGDVNGRQNVLAGTYIDLHWDVIQPEEGGDLDFNSTGNFGLRQVDQALALGMKVFLRFHKGKYTPAYEKAKVGTITVGDPEGGTVDIPKFWVNAFRNDAADADKRLADAYEGNPNVVQVATHFMTSIYAEPCIRQQNGSYNGKKDPQIYYEAGLTHALDLEQLAWYGDTVGGYTQWERNGFDTTRFYMPFNPIAYWDPATSTVKIDNQGPVDIINGLALNFGRHCTLGNNSFRLPSWRAGGQWRTETIAAGGSSTVTFQSTISPAPSRGQMVGAWIVIGSGATKGEGRPVVDYDTTTRVATVSPAWSATPAAGTTVKFATSSVINNGYSGIYKALNEAPVCMGIQTGSTSQLPSAAHEIPGHENDTLAQATLDALDVLFGKTYDGDGTNFDLVHDPENFVAGGLYKMRTRYVEIPGPLDPTITDTMAQGYNALGALMPIG
jgi:hypothetical protein